MFLTNSTEDHLAKVITSLGSEDFSHNLYDWLGRCFEIDNCTIIAFYQTGKPELFFSHSRERKVHERIESDYLSGAYQLDPFYNLHMRNAPERFYRLRDCAPDHFYRHEYVAQYYGRTTLVDEACYHVRPTKRISVQICLGRDRSSQRAFSVRDLKSAQNLSSIVCSLAKKHWGNLRATGKSSDDSVVQILRKRLEKEKGIALSLRQCEVALLILRGHSTISIGLMLEISPQTVKVFRKQLYRKCSISSQAELFALITPLLVD